MKDKQCERFKLTDCLLRMRYKMATSQAKKRYSDGSLDAPDSGSLGGMAVGHQETGLAGREKGDRK